MTRAAGRTPARSGDAEAGSDGAPRVPSPILEMRDVTVAFGGLKALDRLSLAIAADSITAVIGPNGAGKTTLLNTVSGLARPAEGRILLAGRDQATIRRSSLVRLGLSRTYQNLALFPGLDVLGNVLMGAYARQRGSLAGILLRSPAMRRAEAAVRDEALELLGRLGLDDVAHRSVEGLPYGVLKRVELARALASRPRILLLDEPAAGLNHSEVDQLVTLLRAVHGHGGMTMVVVEHHMGLVMNLSHAVTVLNFGQVLASGTPEEVAKDPAVIAAYLGAAA